MPLTPYSESVVQQFFGYTRVWVGTSKICYGVTSIGHAGVAKLAYPAWVDSWKLMETHGKLMETHGNSWKLEKTFVQKKFRSVVQQFFVIF